MRRAVVGRFLFGAGAGGPRFPPRPPALLGTLQGGACGEIPRHVRRPCGWCQGLAGAGGALGLPG
eukprot:10120804-Lingulodinium_polyedra.AAC.1